MLAPTIERDSCRFVPDAWPTHRSIRLVMSLATLVGRHAAVECQGLNRRTAEDGQDVDRDRRDREDPDDDRWSAP